MVQRTNHCLFWGANPRQSEVPSHQMMRNTTPSENSHDNGKNKLNKLYILLLKKCSCSSQPCCSLLEKNHTNKNHGIIEITVLQHHKSMLQPGQVKIVTTFRSLIQINESWELKPTQRVEKFGKIPWGFRRNLEIPHPSLLEMSWTKTPPWNFVFFSTLELIFYGCIFHTFKSSLAPPRFQALVFFLGCPSHSPQASLQQLLGGGGLNKINPLKWYCWWTKSCTTWDG